MKATPISFSDDMIQALLAGKKSETRRLRLGQYKVGQHRWVREAWKLHRTPDREGYYVNYRAGGAMRFPDKQGLPLPKDPFVDRWRPPRFIFKWMSRITIEITAVRTERLQEITHAGAIAEGAHWVDYGRDHMGRKKLGWTMKRPHPNHSSQCHGVARAAFACYINEIHKKDIWDLNPLVDVVGFKILEVKT